jgi:hypothetical protein
LALVKLLQDKGLDVYASDPLLSQEEIEEMGLYFISPSHADVVFDAFNVEVSI